MTISAKVTTNINNIQAKVTPQDRILVTQYAVNAANLRLNDLFNVSTGDDPADGSLLVYNGVASLWEATVTLDQQKQIISGGNY